jgi:L-2,4-diaminobutyric acid acetyltransferase
MSDFTFRKPEKKDAVEIHAMLQPYKPYVGTSPIYTYLLICEHFSDTSIVTTIDTGEIVGFISAYFPPKKSNTLFLWEIAVKEGFHGNGLYLQMVEELYKCNCPMYVEATVNPSNTSFIKRLKQLSEIFTCDFTTYTLFPSDHFGKQDHEDEVLYRIGPVQKNDSESLKTV